MRPLTEIFTDDPQTSDGLVKCETKSRNESREWTCNSQGLFFWQLNELRCYDSKFLSHFKNCIILNKNLFMRQIMPRNNCLLTCIMQKRRQRISRPEYMCISSNFQFLYSYIYVRLAAKLFSSKLCGNRNVVSPNLVRSDQAIWFIT